MKSLKKLIPSPEKIVSLCFEASLFFLVVFAFRSTDKIVLKLIFALLGVGLWVLSQFVDIEFSFDPKDKGVPTMQDPPPPPKRKSKGEWIDAKEQLPQEDGDYLVVFIGWDDMEFTRVVEFEVKPQEWTDFKGLDYCTVTHWMPLPELPE